MWLRDSMQIPFAEALSKVQAECEKQCSCAATDFDFSTTPAASSAAPPSSGSIRVMTFNVQRPNGGAAKTSPSCVHDAGADLILFQEAGGSSSIEQELHGLGGYDTLGGGSDWSAMGFAWQRSVFGYVDGPWKHWVGEDEDNCCCNVWSWNGGKCWSRYIVSVMLEHLESGAQVLVVNYHGVLPINSAGKTGHDEIAKNIHDAIALRRTLGSSIILAGDFNSVPGQSKTLEILSASYGYNLHYHGQAHGGVDCFYSKGFKMDGPGRNLGSCSSDHDALVITLAQIGRRRLSGADASPMLV